MQRGVRELFACARANQTKAIEMAKIGDVDLMRRLKLFALAALALLALGAASVPSASAVFKLEPKACDGTIAALCWEAKEKGAGLQELVGTEEFTVTQESEPTEPLFEALSGGKTLVHFKCKEGTGSGTAIQNEPLVKPPPVEKVIVTFKGCKIVTPATICSIPEEIKTNELTGELTTTDLTLKAKIFAEVEFKGVECVLKGKQPVTGEAMCLWLEAEIDQQGKLCEFTHEDGGLKLGANPASLLAEFEVHFANLETEDLWDIGKA